MPPKLSRRCGEILQSEIRVMTLECERAGGINLAQGMSDIPVPRPVREEAKRAIEDGVNSYTRYDGLKVLRRAVARKLLRFNGIRADPETEITVSSGSTGAFYCACLALLDPGDEVVLFEPYYGYHVNTLRSLSAVPRYVRLREPGWSFSPEDLERAIGRRCKAIVVNTPANPCGKVFTREELGWVVDCARRRGLTVITDEIYEHLVYEGRHLSPATLPGARGRTVTISGLSKTFGVTGWRIGYSVCEPRLARVLGHMNDLVYVCAPAPLQAGAAAGLARLPRTYYSRLREQFMRKRRMLCDALREGGLEPYEPQGAYYVLADVSRLPGKNGLERARHILRKSGVACVAGEAFFHDPKDGARLARFSFGKNDRELREACRRLRLL